MRRRPLRHSETRRAPAALRPAARTRRRDEELGGHPRPEPRSRRQAACGPCRRPSDRIQLLRGHHSAGRIWRRHGDDLGSRALDCRRAIRTRAMPRVISISCSTAKNCTAAGTSCACARANGDRHDNWLLIKGKDEDVAQRTRRRTFWRRSRCRWSAAARSRRSPAAKAKSVSGTATAPAKTGAAPSRRRRRNRPIKTRGKSKQRGRAAAAKIARKSGPRLAAKAGHGCPISSRRLSPRCTPMPRAARNGCTKSNSTATASRRR